MAEVDILLAVKNGEKFIGEQIESILAQTFQDFRLVIRDDGSSDNTPAIIEEYAAKYPGKIQVVHDDVVCRSATKNFFQLLTYAEADYVMFSDQDDYWLPYKVQITLDYMKQTERENPGLPVLAFTGLHVVDEHLHSMDSFMSLGISRKNYELKHAIHGNFSSGCTQMLNKALYSRLGPYSDVITLHDHWVSLYASASGVVCQVPMALILYRQHSHNAIGAGQEKSTLSRIYDFLTSIITTPARKYRSTRHNYEVQRARCALLRARLAEHVSPERLRQVDEVLALFSDSRRERLRAFFKLGYFRDYSLFDGLLFLLRSIIF